MPELRVLPSAEEVAGAAAGEIARALADAISARGVGHWATTGGSSAPGIYHHLGRPPLRDVVDWSRVHVWWGDDRFVPADHPLSNVLPLTQILLVSGGDEETGSPEGADVLESGEGVRLPASHLHPVPVADALARNGGPAWAAALYAEALAASGPPAADGGDPAFDVLVVGVGPDGHILSVFPGSAAWDQAATVLGVPAPTHVEPHVERVTLHPRLVAAARRVIVLTAGASKAEIVARAWAGADPRELPLAAARLPQAIWILDEAAGARIARP